jgi:hypothetical protein
MTMFELLSIVSQFDLALLPLLVLALLPTLTASMGTIGGGVAAAALGAGLGAGQGAIISAATGQDPGQGAAIGAGTGALTGGLGAAAGAGAQGAEAASQGAQAADIAVQTGQGVQTGAQAAQATDIVGALGTPSTIGQPPGGLGGFSLGTEAPIPGTSATPGFDAATAGQPGIGGDPLAGITDAGPGTFNEAPVGDLPPLGASGGTLRTSVAGATKEFDKAEIISKALGGLGQTLGQAGAKPAQVPQNIERRVMPRGRPSSGPRPVDPVLALLAELKRRQAQKIQSRSFF